MQQSAHSFCRSTQSLSPTRTAGPGIPIAGRLGREIPPSPGPSSYSPAASFPSLNGHAFPTTVLSSVLLRNTEDRHGPAYYQPDRRSTRPAKGAYSSSSRFKKLANESPGVGTYTLPSTFARPKKGERIVQPLQGRLNERTSGRHSQPSSAFGTASRSEITAGLPNTPGPQTYHPLCKTDLYYLRYNRQSSSAPNFHASTVLLPNWSYDQHPLRGTPQHMTTSTLAPPAQMYAGSTQIVFEKNSSKNVTILSQETFHAIDSFEKEHVLRNQ